MSYTRQFLIRWHSSVSGYFGKGTRFFEKNVAQRQVNSLNNRWKGKVVHWKTPATIYDNSNWFWWG